MKNNFFTEIKSEENTPYIIAEIGANHNGNMELAKKTIYSAKECGCDAVKFQSWTPSSLICNDEYNRNQKYYDSPKKHFGSLKEMCERYYLREEQHYELFEFCKKTEIEFCSSHFSNDEADLLTSIGVRFLKIASMDINNHELLRYSATKGKPIVLSTGMATIAEIDRAVRIIEEQNNPEIILLHCISLYPPDYKDVNLLNISMLLQTFGYPVGFSDHSIGEALSIASIALGCKIIEKHFTIDKDLPGWDHEISANPQEMKKLVEASKAVFCSMGSYRRIVSTQEEEKKLKFRRSLVASRALSKNHKIVIEDLSSKRPGTGIHPDELPYIVGRILNRDIACDEQIRWVDFE